MRWSDVSPARQRSSPATGPLPVTDSMPWDILRIRMPIVKLDDVFYIYIAPVVVYLGEFWRMLVSVVVIRLCNQTSIIRIITVSMAICASETCDIVLATATSSSL